MGRGLCRRGSGKEETMFICPKCKGEMRLPKCNYCGNVIRQENHIWQISDMPDLVIGSEGDQYIGYEHIGESYSGRRRYLIEERDRLAAGEIWAVNGEGILLDLACGDGCLTVPCAQKGTRIIAGDISNKMLSILQEKAEHNRVLLKNVTLCRMNALQIPLIDESVDTVVANSVLHLISNPRKVLREIYRVLKKGGAFVCLEDRPGKTAGNVYENQKYNEIVSSFYSSYWNKMKARGIMPEKYSWKFDRERFCEALYGEKTEKLIRRGNFYRVRLQDEFLPRFIGRGFSDQTGVPEEIHEKVIEELLDEFRKKYGSSFDETAYEGTEEDILIIIYRKI